MFIYTISCKFLADVVDFVNFSMKLCIRRFELNSLDAIKLLKTRNMHNLSFVILLTFNSTNGYGIITGHSIVIVVVMISPVFPLPVFRVFLIPVLVRRYFPCRLQ